MNPFPHIPKDDLLDVLEMTTKLERYMTEILTDNDLTLAMSALMSASINVTIAQCETIEEVIFFRNLFIQIYDSHIKSIRMKRGKN